MLIKQSNNAEISALKEKEHRSLLALIKEGQNDQDWS